MLLNHIMGARPLIWHCKNQSLYSIVSHSRCLFYDTKEDSLEGNCFPGTDTFANYNMSSNVNRHAASNRDYHNENTFHSVD